MADSKAPYGVVGIYTNVDDVLAAARRVRDAGFTRWDSHTPFPVHGMDGAMGIKMTFLPWITLVMGLTGMAFGVFGQYWVNAKGYAFLISGKPVWSLPANIPVAFEVVIAFSAFTTFFGMLALNKLPRLSHPLHRLAEFARVTSDRFAVVIESGDPRFDSGQVRKLLAQDAEQVVECPADPTRAGLPSWFHGVAAIATCLTLIPLAMAYRGRHATSGKPRYAVWTDMSFQRKAKPQQASGLFDDGRAARKQLDGTIAVGQLFEDQELRFGVQPNALSPVGREVGATGVPDAAWIAGFPAALTVDEAFLDRGQQRFNIYCSVCHGVRGDGHGAVALRAEEIRAMRWGWIAPKNLLSSATIARTNGEIFHIAGHGISTMKGYAAQIPANDRWAIVAWVRALQASQAIDARRAPDAQYQELPALPLGVTQGGR
ncbi:MAG: quinol:electron acceptor oxidoreductase subunit ActD [Planctomycetota bacterium]